MSSPLQNILELLLDKIKPLVVNPAKYEYWTDSHFLIKVTSYAQVMIQMISPGKVRISAQMTTCRTKITYVTEKKQVGVYVWHYTPSDFQRIFDVAELPLNATTIEGIHKAFDMALKEASTYDFVPDVCAWHT